MGSSYKKSGMKGLILTCKHHDGFCLWPSKFTDHTVEFSSWREGNGDLVKEVSESCRKYNLKFGIYISPWDRHDSRYGYTKLYNEFFINQLKELLTGYGPIFSVWFDGACGEVQNGKIQLYDWEKYYAVIRDYQPDACISVCGPDVRWCGNESGITRDEEWSVISKTMQEVEKIQEYSQKDDINRKFYYSQFSRNQNLGSRELLNKEEDIVWYPCEVNTSIRPSWFFTKEENTKLKSVNELVDLYLRTIGGNSTLLLNVPPDVNGLIHETDVRTLNALGNMIKSTFEENKVLSSQYITENEMIKINLGNYITEITLEDFTDIKYVVIQEQISQGQRVEEYQIETLESGKWEIVYSGKTIGYKKIAKFDNCHGRKLRLIISKSRREPQIKSISVY